MLRVIDPCHEPCMPSAHLMPQSHPTSGPVGFLAPVRFLARKAEWSAGRNFMPVLIMWSHQATHPVRFDTAVHLWFDRIIRRTPHGPRGGPAWESPMFFIYYRTSTVPVRDRQGCPTAPLRTRKGIDTTRICKDLAWASFVAVRGPYSPVTAPTRAVHELFTIPNWIVRL